MKTLSTSRRRPLLGERTPAFDAYLKTLNHPSFSPMTEFVEKEIILMYIDQGDLDARDMLIKRNLRFVVHVISHYQSTGVNLSELLSAGNQGLVEGVYRAPEKFNREYNSRFINYLRFPICSSIVEYLKNRHLIPKSWNFKRIENEIDKVEEAFYNEYGMFPDRAYLHDVISKVSPDYINEVCSFPKEIRDIFEEMSPQPDTYENFGVPSDLYLCDTIPDVVSIDCDVTKEDLKKQIQLSFQRLSSRQAEVLCACFGIKVSGHFDDDIQCMGEREAIEYVAMKYDLTLERVRQIKEKALRKLRDNPYSNLLRGYLG